MRLLVSYEVLLEASLLQEGLPQEVQEAEEVLAWRRQLQREQVELTQSVQGLLVPNNFPSVVKYYWYHCHLCSV